MVFLFFCVMLYFQWYANRFSFMPLSSVECPYFYFFNGMRIFQWYFHIFSGMPNCPCVQWYAHIFSKVCLKSFMQEHFPLNLKMYSTVQCALCTVYRSITSFKYFFNEIARKMFCLRELLNIFCV